MFQTRHTRVAGIGNTQGSQRAMNLLVAIRDIQQRTGRDLGATFLSGTVVVNALTELYVLFKYLRPKELSRQCISCFDAWAAIFTKKTTDYELNITGSIKRKERFRTYIKIPELATFLREITDYRTAEMINLDVPQKNIRFLSDKPTIAQEEMIGRLVSFAGSGNWDDLGLDIPQPDNLDMAKMLVATNVARKMALDMRLLGEKFTDDPDNNASRCATIMYVPKRTRVRSSCLAIFRLTSPTSGIYTATSKTSWCGWVFRQERYSLSRPPRPNRHVRSCLRT